MFKKIPVMAVFIFVCVFAFESLDAAQVSLAWDAHADIDGDLAGFELGYSETSGVYVVNVRINKDLTMFTVGGLEQGKSYYFALLAYDTSGNKSGWSDEFNYIVPAVDITAPAMPTTIHIPAGSPVEINIGR